MKTHVIEDKYACDKCLQSYDCIKYCLAVHLKWQKCLHMWVDYSIKNQLVTNLAVLFVSNCKIALHVSDAFCVHHQEY